MATYLVRLNGQNFLIDDGDGPSKKRFCATRLVSAESPEQAETQARNLIRNDPRLKNSVLNKESDPPIVDLESVSEISATTYDAQNRANSLYWEDGEPE